MTAFTQVWLSEAQQTAAWTITTRQQNSTAHCHTRPVQRSGPAGAEVPAEPQPRAARGAEGRPAAAVPAAGAAPAPRQPFRRTHSRSLSQGPNRRALTLCFPRRLRLRHKLHLEQWKKSSSGPILGNDNGSAAATPPPRPTPGAGPHLQMPHSPQWYCFLSRSKRWHTSQ